MGEVVALPAAVCERYLKLASDAAIKTMLWIVHFGRGKFDAKACSASVGYAEQDCEDAFVYWINEGVLLPAVIQQPVQPVVKVTAPATPAVIQQGQPKESTAMKEPTRARPKAVKPQMDEVLRRKENSAEFSYLLDTASARLGRPITHGDMETLCYLYDTAGLPAEVVLMVIAYAVSLGKPNMRYIEKVALDWADRGIDSIVAAEEHLCEMDRRNQAWEQVKGILGIKQSPTIAQSEAVQRWIYEWKMPIGLIQLAGEQCKAQINKVNCNYINKILEHWHLEGIDSVEKAQENLGQTKKKLTKSTETSLDLDEYEKWALNYVPVYNKE